MAWGMPLDAPARGAVARRLAARPTLSAGVLLGLLVLAYLWPVLLGGKVLSADAGLYSLSPWVPYAPRNVASYQNLMLTDIPVVVRPWHELVRQLLHGGVLPAWDPRALTGIPLFQNSQSGLFTPFSVPLWILPFDYALGLTAALKLVVAALGCYLLVRELGLGFLAGIVAGIAFAFCSMNVVWLLYEAVPAVAVLLPWMVWLVERLFRRGGIGTAIALACVTAAALGGGHPGMQAHVLLASGLYALLRTALARGPAGRSRGRTLALALGGLTVGVALTGAMTIPELLSGHETVGAAARAHGTGGLPGLQRMPLGAIRTTLFPDWWGRPSAYEVEAAPFAATSINYEERTFYAGVVALLLAAIGLTNRSALRRQAPFLALGAFGLATALHAPGLWWVVEHVPLLDLVENQRLHFLFELAVAVLAAFGLQAIVERPAERRRQLAVVAGAVAVALLAAATSGASWSDAGKVVTHFLTGRDFRLPGVVALTSVAWALLLALGVAVALLALRRRPRHGTAIATALVLLAALDMLHFAHGYNPMGPRNGAILPRTPAIAYLQQHQSEGRVAAIGLALLPDAASRFGLNDVRGYDPPYPTRRFLELWQAASPQQAPWLPTILPALNPAAVQVTGALGARFLVTNPEITNAGLGDPALGSLQRVYSGSDATIFVNPRSAPRAFVPAVIELAPTAASTNAALLESRFEAQRGVVVEADQPRSAGLAGVQGANGSATIVAEGDSSVTLRATLDRRGIVVLADQLLDGWRVRVDGRPAIPLRVNAVLRGVVVGPGRHLVAWSYQVPGLAAGAALSAAALAVLAGAVLLRARRRAALARR